MNTNPQKLQLIALAACLLLALPVGAGGKPTGGKPTGGKSTRYQVAVVADVGIEAPVAPAYLPTCTESASASSSNYSYVPQPRHDPCAIVTTSTGYQLTDDIGITVTTTKGWITSITLHGQDVIGEEGIMHRSEQFAITPAVKPPSSGFFTLHVHADNLPVWQLSGHLGGDPVEIVGYISIDDITYTPE